MYVRGGTPDQNLVLYDGFTVYQVDHLYGFFSAFNSNALKDIQLYKGGFESRFGGRLSSVTEITGKDGNDKAFNAGAEISFLGFNGFVEGPIGGKTTFLLAARRSYKGPIYNKIFDKFNDNSTTNNTQTGGGFSGPGGGQGFANFQTKASSFFYDINSKITYKLTPKDNISFSVFNGTDKLDNGFDLDNSSLPSFGGGSGQGGGRDFSVSNTDLTKYGNTGLSLKWNRTWTDRLYGSTLASYSYYFSDRDRTNSVSTSDDSSEDQTVRFGTLENNDLRDFSLKTDYTYDLSNEHHLGFGAFASKLLIDYTFSQNDTSTILDKNDRGLVAGFYLQDKMKLMENKLTVVPGARLSYFDMTGKPYLEPRLSASYSLTAGFTVRASTGRFYQFANRITREDILSGSRDFWILSNDENIPVSSAEHYIFGGSYENKGFLFSVEGYYKKLQSLSEYSLRFNTSPREISLEENFYNGDGYAKGIEFLVQKKYGDFTGWVSYTLGQTRNKFAVYSDEYFPANQDVTHEFKAVSIYSANRWSFSATWIYATGRPYTAPSGAYSITLLDGTTSDYFSTTDKNSLRFPNYHRLDLAATYSFYSIDQEREIGGLSFSIFNLYNHTNVWHKQYSIVDSEIIETDVTYLGITPNLTLTLKLR
ncbi:TonB-dependent receptor [Imperialibacter roseus]|uniref:TonB-dependent receptor n=1 Tax=Imperialibacter roseus TaxID=1324217 RepID=A0ABZ0IV22_9BACT|nr:TonB-dependent receptor [Imperialibacter roseus]WOK07994.1 TonB-dependent receptor [Imperialibacter roseus]